LRDLLAHAAGDVADAAIQVRGMAGDVEDRVKAQSMPTKVGLDDLPATVVNSLVDEAKDRNEECANKMRGIKDEWENLVEKLLAINPASIFSGVEFMEDGQGLGRTCGSSRLNMSLFCVCNRYV